MGSAQRRGSRPTPAEYPCMMKPMRTPKANCTNGRLSAPRSAMKADRVTGLRAVYEVITRNE